MKTILPVVLTLLIFVSCKKDKEIPQPNPPVIYDNYSNLKVGNYWIYQIYEVDSTGYSFATASYDSCYVEKDTLINDQVYFKVIRPFLNSPAISSFFWRDSLHYLVDATGAILFSSLDFTNSLQSGNLIVGDDTLYSYSRKMTEKDVLTNTPAGNFLTSNGIEEYKIYNPTGIVTRIKNFKVAKNIGFVVETKPFFISQNNMNLEERRLIRYHVN